MIELKKCLCCEGSLTQVLDWGSLPLANNYNNKGLYPIKLNVCNDCHHLQLDSVVEPEILFKDYPYFSGTSKTSLDYFKEFAEMTLRRMPKAKNILDIACNDGAQLDAYKTLGLKTYGIDPAQNLLSVSTKKGHTVVCDIVQNYNNNFDVPTFDIITAQNVVAHTSDPLTFIIKCRELMNYDSHLFIATSQANMVLGNEFDTVYHEHVSYFNTTSMKELVEHAGMVLVDVFTNPIHGTSYIFVIKKSKLIDPVIEREQLEISLQDTKTYHNWVTKSHEKANKTKAIIEDYRKQGYLIIGCGAAAKGITFLNVTGTKMDMILDTTPAKWYNSVCDTNIFPFEVTRSITANKVLFVILAWNFKEEIKSNILKFRNNDNDIFITTNEDFS